MPPVSLRRMRTAVRDGVTLAYERADGERAPIALIHGWCCDHSYFAPQFEHLADRGHTVVAVDLRGHGASDAPAGDYAVGALADDVAWLLAEIEIERPVVIGHSMGGVVGYDLAVRHSAVPSALVMIDSPVARMAASRAGMPAFLERLDGQDAERVLTEYVESALLLPTDELPRREKITERMSRTAHHVMAGAFEGMYEFDPDELEGRVRVPSLFIAADTTPLSDVSHLLELMPEMQFGQTVGSGHFCPLEVPDQVNAMLDRFLDLVAGTGAA
jgi:pimeloyl-ACP methyl ester carboxylesterase